MSECQPKRMDRSPLCPVCGYGWIADGAQDVKASRDELYGELGKARFQRDALREVIAEAATLLRSEHIVSVAEARQLLRDGGGRGER